MGTQPHSTFHAGANVCRKYMAGGVLRIIRERMLNMTWGKTHMSAVCMVYVSKDVSIDV